MKKYTLEFIRENRNTINWNEIALYISPIYNEEFIREFKDNIDWDRVSTFTVLSEDFIREFQYKINWRIICNKQILSEDFIRTFEYAVDWKAVSKYQELSEDFITEFENKVDWYNILTCQRNLSETFMIKYKFRIDDLTDVILNHGLCSKNFIEEVKDNVDWRKVRKFLLDSNMIHSKQIIEYDDMDYTTYINLTRKNLKNYIRIWKKKI